MLNSLLELLVCRFMKHDLVDIGALSCNANHYRPPKQSVCFTMRKHVCSKFATDIACFARHMKWSNFAALRANFQTCSSLRTGVHWSGKNTWHGDCSKGWFLRYHTAWFSAVFSCNTWPIPTRKDTIEPCVSHASCRVKKWRKLFFCIASRPFG